MSVYVARTDRKSGDYEIDASYGLNITVSEGPTGTNGLIAECKARRAPGCEPSKKAWALPLTLYASFWRRCTLMLSNIDSRDECHDE